jgi:CRISPR/Cas system CMR subunit Cmr4 (Cas7 group RAMP superfamily)
MLVGNMFFNGIGEKSTIYKHNLPGYEIFAEDISLSKAAFIPLVQPAGVSQLTSKYAVLSTDDFKSVVSALPVIARNHLENGISQNLWYEEIVPHKTLFLTFIGLTDTFRDDFEAALEADLIQVGANATIGYGLCKFSKVNFK